MHEHEAATARELTQSGGDAARVKPASAK